MNAVSNIQKDLKFQDLVLPDHGSNLTPYPENGIATQCNYQHYPHSSSGSTLTRTYGTHLPCPVMPTQNNQKSTAVAKSTRNHWQPRNKNTSRQQQLQHIQQGNLIQPLNLLSSQATTNFQSSATYTSSNQKLIILDPAQPVGQSCLSQTQLLPPRNSTSPNDLNLGCSLGPLQQTSQSLYPLLQLSPCIEQQNSNHSHTYCILEGMSTNSSPAPVAIPYIVNASQMKASPPNSYYNQASANFQSLSTLNNNSHQTHQYRQQQQYPAGRYRQTQSQPKQQQLVYQTPPQQSQFLVFRPPPREKIKSPTSQNSNTLNESSRPFNSKSPQQREINKYPTSSSRNSKSEGNKDPTVEVKTQVISNTQNLINSKSFPTGFNAGCKDAITTIQSTWLSTQPLGNVHLVMGLAAGNVLKKQESAQSPSRKETYPKPIARPTTAMYCLPDSEHHQSEENQVSHLHSDSSTSFEFSIEAEKMVSALCNSSTVKDLDSSEYHNPTENCEKSNFERKHVLLKKNSETHLQPTKIIQLGVVDSKNATQLASNKDWNAANKAASDDEISVNTVSTSEFQNAVEAVNSQSLGDCEDAENVNNVNGFPLRLSPSSNSSNGTTQNTESRNINICFPEEIEYRNNSEKESHKTQSNESKKINKVRNVYCQTNNLECVQNEQLKFRKTTMKGCHEINKIIEEYMSPSLEGLSQFCTEVRQAVSKPETFLVSESFQKDLITGFLKLANCWTNLYPVLGSTRNKIHYSNTLGTRISHVYQNWTAASQKLMEEIIKIFECPLNLDSIKKQPSEKTHLNQGECNGYTGQGLINNGECAFDLNQSCYSSCCPMPNALVEAYGDPSVVLTTIPQNEVAEYPSSSPLDTMAHAIHHSTPQQMNDLHLNNKSNWRVRRFSDSQIESAELHNQTTCKGKGIFHSPKDNGKRWNINSSGSAVSFHSSYGNFKYCDTTGGNSRKTGNNGNSSSRNSRSESYINQEKYNNRQHTGSKCKQKSTMTGKKTSTSHNIETQLRDKALETLDGFTKQWKQQQFEVLKNPEEHQLYVNTMSGDQIPSLSKSNMISLSQIESPHSPTQHIDLSTWFQNLGCSIPVVDNPQLTASEVAYSDRINHPVTVLEPADLPNKAQQAARRHSYQDARNQMTGGKGSTWPNKKNIIHKNNKPPNSSRSSIMIYNDEHDSSDDLQDRIYMKPGSYDVPKRRPPAVTKHTTPLILKNPVANPDSSSVSSQSPVGIVVPFPAAPLVPPPSRSLDMSPRILRHIQLPKTQSPTTNQSNDALICSDIVWKKACQSAGSLLETLQSNTTSPTSPEGSLEAEIRRITEGECTKNTDEDNGENNVDEEEDEDEIEKETTPKSSSGRRKGSTEKTDHWLIRTLNNVSKLQNENDLTGQSKTENELLSTVSEPGSNTSNNTETTERTINTENQKESEITTAPNVQKPASLRNLVNRRTKDIKKNYMKSPKNKKSHTGAFLRKSHQVSGKNYSDSRKRKLQERSPNEEQNAQNKNDEEENTNEEKAQNVSAVNTNNSNNATSKIKTDLRNKANWNVWYSSRRRRGLSALAVNKLEDTLNMIWNMDASDFVKYPVSSNEDNDYYKLVKHPMFLETIGYKLKNRIYETIEQFVHDFRRIFLNAKQYNKDDPAYLDMTNILESKFNRLLEEHFSGWEFGHITGDPNETQNIPALHYLAYSEKSTSSKNRRAKSSSNKPTNAVNSNQSSPTDNDGHITSTNSPTDQATSN